MYLIEKRCPMKVWTEITEYGQKTLFIERNGNPQPLYSRHAPRKDGLKFFRDNHEKGCDFYIFIGLGLGYQIEPFVLEPGVRRIVILEPVKELFTAVQGEDIIKKLLVHPKVEICTGEDVERFIRAVKTHYEWLFYKKIRVLPYQPIRRIFESLYSELERHIKVELNSLINDSLTIAKFSVLWLKNFFKNVGTLTHIRPVSSLYNCSSGSVIITGAGPSLDCAIIHIKKKRKDFFLIATDASFKPLVRNGITPDLLVSMDPGPHVYSHFSGLDSNALSNIPAVLSFLSFPKVFELFRDRYIFFTLHPTTYFYPSEYLKDTVIFSAMSVASLALKVALQMGFEYVLLAGFDFSYPGIRLYAKDTFFMDYGLSRNSRFIPFQTMEAATIRKGSQQIEGKNGRMLSTSYNLIDYMKEIEGIIQGSGNRKILLFDGTVSLKGVRQVTVFPDGMGYRWLGARNIKMPIGNINIDDKGTVRGIMTTLALRYRIYKNVEEVGVAYERAREYLKIYTKKNRSGIKFEIHDSDI
jgi:hypothetical protein